MEGSRLARRRVIVTALIAAAASVWALWVAYAAVALTSERVPATWPVFALFLAGILVFLLPAFALMLYRARPDSPLRFHAGIWLIITGYFWIIAPLYQYLAINTNRELVLWYMIPYAWEVPVLGFLYYLPVALWYRRGKNLARLPLFAALYFAFIALIGYGPIGSYQFRVFGEAPWPEVIKNAFSGTMMGFVSGFIVYFFVNQNLRGRQYAIRRQLLAIAGALALLAYAIYVPVSYRSAQELLAAEVREDLEHKLEVGEGELMRRSDVQLLGIEPALAEEISVLDHAESFYSHRGANRIIAVAPAGEFLRVLIKSESDLQYLLAPFLKRGAVVGAVFGAIFVSLMMLIVLLAEAHERERNKELHEKSLVVERVLADVKVVDEKLAQLNRAKSEFISMASHQLRTPLTTVKWYAKLLEKDGTGALSTSQRRALHHMAASNQKMIELVGDLLNVSRLEIGTISNAPERVNLRDFVRALIADHVPLARERSVQLVATGIPSAALTIDPKLLTVVLSNLVTNAIRYSPPGKGKVTVSGALTPKEVTLSVRDNGFGIPADEQQRIFSKFFRASNVREKAPEGTGLGLYIVKSVLDKLGGRVAFTSAPGRGTIFTVTFPKNKFKYLKT